MTQSGRFRTGRDWRFQMAFCRGKKAVSHRNPPMTATDLAADYAHAGFGAKVI
jgi:hypothetical protein